MKTARVLALLAVVLTTVGCDRVTKQIAAATLAGVPGREYLAATVRFEYAENTGAFLSLGADLPEWMRTSLFTVGVGILLSALMVVIWRNHSDGRGTLGLCFILAGGASNLFDRIVQGSVVDFISVGVGPLRTGIFNVADVAILLGGLIVFVSAQRLAKTTT